MVQIGTKIKKIRELKNLTQEYMADQLNVSQSTYSRFEKEDSDLTLSQIQKVADILEVKPEDLLNFNEQVVINNYSSNQANQAYSIINNVSPAEKELYEKYIATLEKEVEYLKGLVDRLTK